MYLTLVIWGHISDDTPLMFIQLDVVYCFPTCSLLSCYCKSIKELRADFCDKVPKLPQGQVMNMNMTPARTHPLMCNVSFELGLVPDRDKSHGVNGQNMAEDDNDRLFKLQS